MKRSFSQGVILLTTAAIAVVLTGCPESKVSQCNKMIEVANKAVTASQDFAKNPQPENGSKSLTAVADQMDGFASSMEALELSDEKLKGFQADFAKMYKLASAGLREGATAIDNKDQKALMASMEKLQEDTSEEGDLVNSTNTYCSQ